MRNLIGYQTGKLQVKCRAGSNRNGLATWLCECECGKEKVFSSDHLTRKKNPVKSCGCERVRRGSNHAQWTGCGEITGSWWYNHVLRELFGKSRRSQIEVTVTIEEAWDLFLIQNRSCALTGLPLEFATEVQFNTASLDRIDSAGGYTLDNVQWVHKHINFMKRTYSQEYFVKMCKLVAAYADGVCDLSAVKV